MPHFARACVDYLDTYASAHNACVLLYQSRLFDEAELMQHCLDVIDSQGKEALQSDSFTDIDYQTLELILSRDTLCVEETIVYAATIRWAEAECVRQRRDASPQQCREILGDLLYLIRFPTMTVDDFVNGAGRSEILSQGEIHNIFLYLKLQDKPEQRFPTSHRRSHIRRCLRFNALGASWNYNTGRCHSIQFSVDKTISIFGFGVYGSCGSPGERLVDIALKHKETVLRKKCRAMFSDGSGNTVDLLFDSPFRIEANTFYTANVIFRNGMIGHYGKEGMSRVTCDNIHFNFMNTSDSSTNVIAGNIPKILFHYSPNYSWISEFSWGCKFVA